MTLKYEINNAYPEVAEKILIDAIYFVANIKNYLNNNIIIEFFDKLREKTELNKYIEDM